MKLGALAAAVRSLAPDARARIERANRQNLDVAGVTHDSRAVAPGVVFGEDTERGAVRIRLGPRAASLRFVALDGGTLDSSSLRCR